MSGGACKTVICATGRVADFGEKKLRAVFANPEIANAVDRDLEHREDIWTCLESADMNRKEKDFLRDRLKDYATL